MPSESPAASVLHTAGARAEYALPSDGVTSRPSLAELVADTRSGLAAIHQSETDVAEALDVCRRLEQMRAPLGGRAYGLARFLVHRAMDSLAAARVAHYAATLALRHGETET